VPKAHNLNSKICIPDMYASISNLGMSHNDKR
jgi:hypothetical protein